MGVKNEMKVDVTRWSGVIENLAAAQLDKKCTTIYGSRSYCSLSQVP